MVFMKMSEVGTTAATYINQCDSHVHFLDGSGTMIVASWNFAVWRLFKQRTYVTIFFKRSICFPVMTVTTEPLQLKIWHLVHRNVIRTLLGMKCFMLQTTDMQKYTLLIRLLLKLALWGGRSDFMQNMILTQDRIYLCCRKDFNPWAGASWHLQQNTVLRLHTLIS